VTSFGKTVILLSISSSYFNDVLIASTASFITYERESADQKEYIFTNLVSELTASIFASDIEIIKNDKIQIEIL
jgi:hypothetical protein